MRKDETYKGFEIWFNGLQMTIKMHSHIVMILAGVHVLATLLLSSYWLGELYGLVIKYLVGAVSNFAVPDMRVIEKPISFILKKNTVFFLVCSPVWLLYPWMLRKFKTKAKKQAERQYLSGAREVEAKEFKATIPKGDIPIGSFALPKAEEIKHIWTIGRPGTGKTVFLSAVAERLRQRREKMIVYDFKGDFTSKFCNAETDILFNPLDTRSVGWNVFAEIKTQLDINTMAESLIPPVYSGDAFWNDAARAVFAGILHYLWSNNLRTNADIWRAVTAPGQEIRDWLASVPGGARGLRFVEDASSKQAMGVFAVMMQYTAAFEYLSRADGDFSIDKWLTSPGGCIFVTNKSEVRDTLKPILSLFVDLLSKKLLSLPDDLSRRVFFILDEFGTLQRLSSIKDLLIASRSKGGSAWLGIQDMGQINKLYTPDVAATIVNACGTSVMFAVSDPKTACYLRDKIGDTEFIEPQQTTSFGIADNRDGGSLTDQRKVEKLLKDSDFMNLPDLTAYVKIPNVAAVARTLFKYKSYPTVTESFIIRPDLLLEEVAAKEISVVEDSDYYRREAKASKPHEVGRENDYEPEIDEQFNF